MSGNGARWARNGAQVLGFAAGIALLAWCVHRAFSPENREQLGRLRDAGAGEVGALAGLSVLSLILNGLAFWVMVRPVKRVDVLGMLSTNSLATFLNYLPFKIGVLTRVVVHNRRDGIPVVTIGAWFGAMAAALVCALAPPCAATLWLKRVDAAWYAVTGVGVVGLTTAAVMTARVFAGERGAERLRRIVRVLPWGARFAGSRFFLQAHAGTAILDHGPTVVMTVVLRLADLAVQALRFLVAARVLHVELGVDTAVMAAAVFFLIGVFSPSGMLGTREGGTAWLLGGTGAAAAFTSVTLLVGGAELVVNLVGAALGVVYLRPHRLMEYRKEAGGDDSPRRR